MIWTIFCYFIVFPSLCRTTWLITKHLLRNESNHNKPTSNQRLSKNKNKIVNGLVNVFVFEWCATTTNRLHIYIQCIYIFYSCVRVCEFQSMPNSQFVVRPKVANMLISPSKGDSNKRQQHPFPQFCFDAPTNKHVYSHTYVNTWQTRTCCKSQQAVRLITHTHMQHYKCTYIHTTICYSIH